MIRHTKQRTGFTLVELLVSMALAVLILALAVGVSQSSAFESFKITGAADRVSQWMLVAKQRALRDNRAVGIRLIPDATNNNLFKEIAYIEQPEPIPSNGILLKPNTVTFNGNPVPIPSTDLLAQGAKLIFYYPTRIVQTSPTGMPPNTFTPTPVTNERAVYLSNLTNDTITELTTTTSSNYLRDGDFIVIPELGAVLKLRANPVAADANPAGSPGMDTSVATPFQRNALKLQVQVADLPDLPANVFTYHPSSTLDGNPHPSILTSPNNGTLSVSNFGIIRAPRVLMGEQTQQLPVGMAIDATNSHNPPRANPTLNYRDILFSPSGEVVGAEKSITALLLRDTALPGVTTPLTTDYDKAGQLILICIYNRTGAIATQPVNPPATPADPYKFAKDGINTGL